MNQRTVFIILIAIGAAGGYYWWSQRNKTNQSGPNADQVAKDLENYNAQPTVGAQSDVTSAPQGNVDLQKAQAMPLPYNG